MQGSRSHCLNWYHAANYSERDSLLDSRFERSILERRTLQKYRHMPRFELSLHTHRENQKTASIHRELRCMLRWEWIESSYLLWWMSMTERETAVKQWELLKLKKLKLTLDRGKDQRSRGLLGDRDGYFWCSSTGSKRIPYIRYN